MFELQQLTGYKNNREERTGEIVVHLEQLENAYRIFTKFATDSFTKTVDPCHFRLEAGSSNRHIPAKTYRQFLGASRELNWLTTRRNRIRKYLEPKW